MTRETLEDLSTNTLIGMTDRRGNAWHWRKGDDNHYDDAIPVQDVRDRLFNWSAVQGTVAATALTSTGVLRGEATDKKAVMRSDNGAVLGIHGATYQIHQYDQWLIDNVATLLDADLVIGSAGLLQGGRKAWVQIELRDTLEVAGEQLRPFLTAATAHDGSMATSYVTGAIRTVCDNTLDAALRLADTSFKVRHSTNSLSKIGKARDALGIVHQVADEFEDQVKALTAKTVTDRQWKEFVERFSAPSSNTERSKNMAQTKVGQLNRLYRYDERVAPWAGTAWGALQAVNTWSQHVKTVKGTTRDQRNQLNALNGTIRKDDQAALDLLLSV